MPGKKNDVQRAHIMMAIRAFLRFEVYRIRTGISWFETKWNIIRNAVNQYMRNPSISFTMKIEGNSKVAYRAGNRISPIIFQIGRPQICEFLL